MVTDADLAFFARNGFLHLEKHLDVERCEKLVDHTWTRMPAQWDRADPASWTTSLGDSCHVADLKTRRGLLQFQKGDLIGNPLIEGSFGPSSAAGEYARALIGGGEVTMRVRGLYAIVPLDAAVRYNRPVRPHIEAHSAQLIALHYLEDVVPGGGGLAVWPGSHRDIYPVMGSKLEHVVTPQYDEIYSDWCTRAPVELSGKRGDVVIIHHRLLHAPSLNRSDRIRYGFLCDYQRRDFRELAAQKPSQDIWEDWPAVAALGEDVLAQPCDFTLLPSGGSVDARPMHVGASALSVEHTGDADPSSVRKADASLLARSRQDGEVWVHISDSPQIVDDRELFPRGARWHEAAFDVTLDGTALKSLVTFDFIAKIAGPEGPHTLRITGATRKLYVKVLLIRLPFVRTEFLAQAVVDTSDVSVTFQMPGEMAAAPAAIA
jgi:hypothetical protein